MSTISKQAFGWTSGQAEQSHTYLLPTVMNILSTKKVSSLLDIGSGNGSTLPAWRAAGVSRLCAMEPDIDGFLLSSEHVDVDLRNIGIGDTIPVEWREAFDAVVCLEVVEHLYNPSELVSTANNVLQKSGIIIVSTPYHGYLKNVLLSLSGKWDFHHHPIRTGGHIKFWSRPTLTDLFIQQGFEEVSFTGVGRTAWLWKSMIMVFRKPS
jgi:2-polyprenyl-3-methyl-5-hydroxy-6-metoxy-1,4-benzoquinol methylase